MPYIDAKESKEIRDQIKKAYPAYKWSVTAKHGMEINVALMESDIGFERTYDQVNHYWYKDHDYPVKAKLVFQHVLEIIHEVSTGNPYIHLAVGQWDKHHKVTVAAGVLTI